MNDHTVPSKAMFELRKLFPSDLSDEGALLAAVAYIQELEGLLDGYEEDLPRGYARRYKQE